jgi:hypothetical protein
VLLVTITVTQPPLVTGSLVVEPTASLPALGKLTAPSTDIVFATIGSSVTSFTPTTGLLETPVTQRSSLPAGEGESAPLAQQTSITEARSTGSALTETIESALSTITAVAADPTTRPIGLAAFTPPSSSFPGDSLESLKSWRVYELSGDRFGLVSIIDEIIQARFQVGAGGFGHGEATDAAFAANSSSATTESRLDQWAEVDLLADEDLIDIAELTDEPSRGQPRRLRTADRSSDEPPVEDRSSADSEAASDWHALRRLLRRLRPWEPADDDRATRDRAPTAHQEGDGGGMIELAHAPVPSRGTCADGRNASVEFLKTDGACARYQAFEVACPWVAPPATGALSAEDVGEHVSSEDATPVREASAAETASADARKNSSESLSSSKALVAPALLAGFLLRGKGDILLFCSAPLGPSPRRGLQKSRMSPFRRRKES